MRLQQAPNCAVVPADVSQRTATTRSRGRPAAIVVVVIVVINLPPRTPPSFFFSLLTAAAVHPPPPPPPPRHKVGGKAAVSNLKHSAHSFARAQSIAVCEERFYLSQYYKRLKGVVGVIVGVVVGVVVGVYHK